MNLLTPRLRIRSFDLPRDAVRLRPLYSDPRVMRFIGGEVPDDVEAFLRVRLARQSPAPCGFWVVERRADGEPIGTALIDRVPASTTDADPMVWSGEVQLGGALRRDVWGQGYATEVGRGLLDHARAHGLPRVLALHEPPHEASAAVVRALGFVWEGPTDAYYGGTTLVRWVWAP